MREEDMNSRTKQRPRWSALGAIGVAAVAVMLVGAATSRLMVSRAPAHHHPEPRPGVTAERVLLTFSLPREIPTTVAAYEAAARIPAWLDGIRCYCACSATLGHRSLLSCFEDEHGALCQVCQDEALIAGQVAGTGGMLEDARREVDARFGPPT
jgi:hypothetical protein